MSPVAWMARFADTIDVKTVTSAHITSNMPLPFWKSPQKLGRLNLVREFW